MTTNHPPESDDTLHAERAEEELSADAFLRAHRRARRLKIALLLAACGAMLLAALYLTLGASALHAWRHHQLSTQRAEALADMDDLERVHAELLPSWIIQASQGRAGEAQAFEALLVPLERDQGAVEILRDLRGMIQDHETLLEQADRPLELARVWNARLDRAREPWWIDANVMTSSGRSLFYVKTYKILADFDVTVRSKTYRTRVAARADRTNVVESKLGHTSPHQDGAIVLADRIYEFTLRDVWPLLDERVDAARYPGPVHRAFAPALRHEITAQLAPEHVATLRRSAEARLELELARQSVASRRLSCNSQFLINALPWRGFPEEELEQLEAFAERERHQSCPAITEDEVEALSKASETLRDTEGLELAVEHLVAVISRPISVHEARHSADQATLGDFSDPLVCPKCDEAGLSSASRAELSAYLATFAARPDALPRVALYQSCLLDLARPTPHARALRLARAELQLDCTSPPHDNFGLSAAEMERTWLLRSDPITLPKDYPVRIELYRQ